MSETTVSEEVIRQEVRDNLPWYAVYLFGTRQKSVADFFDENRIDSFYPQQYVYFEKDGQRHRELRPVVSNLIFVKCEDDNTRLLKLLEEMPFKHHVFRKTDSKTEYYEIPAAQMAEFKRMCNPEIELRKYVSEEEARMKPGTEVYVKYGPLKGLTGRLVRSNKKYYLLKEMPGIGIQLKVARWCCVPVGKDEG